MILYRNIKNLLTMERAFEKKARFILCEDLSIKYDHSILVNDKNKILWMGPDQKIPKNWVKQKNREINASQMTVLPGFVECHTHSVFAGSRAEEFELRNQGVSYQEMARRGGGILSTVKKVDQTSEKELLEISQKRVDEFTRQGVTTLEIKSGYGLDYKNEIKMLQVTNKLKGPKIVPTFLGAHALPPSFSSHDEYLNFLCQKVLPVIKSEKLSNRVDIFIEKGFFEKQISIQYLKAVQKMGFQIVIHSDQLSNSGGTDLAIRFGALSADHVICVRNKEIQRLAKSEVTAVLLPVADLFLKCSYPPARKMIDSGVRVALATDYNPGSAPIQDLNLVGLLARLEMKMTLPEVLVAYTVGAAYALGMENEIGSLQVGKEGDLVCFDCDWQELFYSQKKPIIF